MQQMTLKESDEEAKREARDKVESSKELDEETEEGPTAVSEHWF